MTLASLPDVLNPALKDGYAVAGLVVLGWEDARSFVRAGEAEGLPVILQAGPACRKHTPLSVLGEMFRFLGKNAGIPVVAHLDHGYSTEECREAIECGFTSVMFDGSRNDLSENIDQTAAIAEIAHAYDVSCEGEIGFVGYDGGEDSACTNPEKAALFARETKVDALAVSVGNVHLQRRKAAKIDFDAVRAIESATSVPLVIHGGSGIDEATRRKLARTTAVSKFNIGTELRMVFGNSLRAAVNLDAERFDRIQLLSETEKPVEIAAREIIRSFGPGV